MACIACVNHRLVMILKLKYLQEIELNLMGSRDRHGAIDHAREEENKFIQRAAYIMNEQCPECPRGMIADRNHGR
jgi:hypothetical protein